MRRYAQLCAYLLAALFALRPAAAEVPAEVGAAVDRGVAFLLAGQGDDGRFTPNDRHAVALTSLSCTALLSVGHQVGDDTPEGRALAAGVEFVLDPAWVDAEGYLGGRDGSRMYGHGITTLFLSELSGMTADARQEAVVRERLTRAIDLILRAQAAEKWNEIYLGGWRYQPTSGDSDLSVSVWQAMALRSAQAAGVDVPAAAVEAAAAYLERSYRPEPASTPAARFGRFGYQPSERGGNYSFSTTAAGLLAMQVLGRYDAESVEGSANWLMTQPLRPGQAWFFYGLYYFAQGMNQRGGEAAVEARRRTEAVLLELQRDDGSWRGVGAAPSPVYATAMAVLTLSVEYGYLPIYQR